jgi:hypothetical protein
VSRDLDHIRRDVHELAAKLQRFAEHHEPCGRCAPPHDGKPRLRPHTIPGWWQVWSGGICIALLSDEDIAPVTEELRGRLKNAEDALRERVEPRRASQRRSGAP